MGKKKIVNKKLKKKDLEHKLQFYKAIHDIPNPKRCSIIPYLSDEATDLLCEAVYNSIKVDLGFKGPKKQQLIKELKACGTHLNHICKKSTPHNKRKKFLSQKGGFLGTLLGLVIPTVVSLISSLASKKS